MKNLESEIKDLLEEGKKLNEIKKVLEEKYRKELSFTSLSFFSYLFMVGFPILIVATFILKILHPQGFYYYLTRLFLLIGAMGTLKGTVGHFVGVFLKRERFQSVFEKLKANKEEQYGN